MRIMDDCLGFAACYSNQIEATVKRVYSTKADEESFRIYNGTSSSEALLLSHYGSASNNGQTYYFSLCLIPDKQYLIYVYDSYRHYDGWSSGSYLEISYPLYH